MTVLQRLFIATQYLIPQHLLSRLAGYLADTNITWLKNFLIVRFIAHYDVDMSEVELGDPTEFSTFNEFFTRALKPSVRPIERRPNSIVAPADGVVSEAGEIVAGTLLQAKGQHFQLQALLGGDKELAAEFDAGNFVTVYLSPRDYHRVHMPVEGTLRKSIYVPGDLFSVNNTTAEHVPNLFARNERLVCVFDHPSTPFVLVLVGAVIVAGIETVWSGQVTPKAKSACISDYSRAILLDKGSEMGRFKLGSTVIALFPKDKMQFQNWVKAGSETRVGTMLGELN
ncbi:MAG: phosphatidylserine decarboxylase [Pseudomonadales bacterium]|nr:MAG: phosphatidylserine decarboxylase [Pseudomonadales bacterium]